MMLVVVSQSVVVVIGQWEVINGPLALVSYLLMQIIAGLKCVYYGVLVVWSMQVEEVHTLGA